MATAEMKSAMEAIPSKVEDLRKSYHLLTSFSSALLTFNLKWKDLEDHFSSLHKSIQQRMQELDSKASQSSNSNPTPIDVTIVRPELSSFCLNMDGLGLRSYIVGNRTDVAAIRNELAAALGLAPDPPRLILDALDGFNREKGKGEKDGDLQVIKRTCLNFLEQLRCLQPQPVITDSVKSMAKKIGEEWMSRIVKDGDVGENGVEALAFLELLAAYRLVPEFDKDDILNVFVSISRRRQAAEHCKNLGLGEHMSDLIEKLSAKGRLLDAVKFVHHLNLADKYPLVPLVKNYLKDSRKTAQEIREKGNNSKQAKNEATAKELSALKAVVKAVEDYNLQSQFSCDELNKRITQLEQQKANKKRPAPAAAGAAASNTKRRHMQQPPNKRSRPMASLPSMTSSQYAVSSHPPPPLAHNQSQLGLVEQPQYQGFLGPYGLARTGAPYDASVPNFPGPHYAISRNRSPPLSRTQLYSAESLLGAAGVFNMPVAFGGYAPSSHTTSTSSLYPKGI